MVTDMVMVTDTGVGTDMVIRDMVMGMDIVAVTHTDMVMGMVTDMAWARTLSWSWRALVAWSLLGVWRRLMLALDPCWLYLDLRLLSSDQRRASASVGALLVLSFGPETRGWLFWKSGDAYSS